MIIKTPSRLHMTLIDLNGSYGRSDGGIGLTIAKPNFSLKCEPIDKGISVDFAPNISNDSIEAECYNKICAAAKKLLSYYDIDKGFQFTVEEAYPPHSGLGSGTQISLATSKLIHEHLKEDSSIIKPNNFKENITGAELAHIIGRGQSSGIGMFAFDHGGLILDGGHDLKRKGSILPPPDYNGIPPQLIGTFKFPEEWEVIVATPKADTSVTGEKEIEIFAANCPVPKTDVEQLSHLILMNLIPFLLEKNIICFGKTINKIQTLGFKKVEVMRQPERIRSLMNKMLEFGAYGVGMSSFGPSIYAITHKNTKQVFNATKDIIGDEGNVFITKAQNHGYELIK